MTVRRRDNARPIDCQNCGIPLSCLSCKFPATMEEVGFNRWSRNNKNLDSRYHGVVSMNIDSVWHMYRVMDVRDNGIKERMHRQHFMFIEEKFGEGTKATWAQNKTMQMMDAMLQLSNPKNRTTITVDGETFTPMWHGCHLLNTDKECSFFKWDGDLITSETLERILLFNLDPRNIRRKRTADYSHHGKAEPLLPGLFEVLA